MGTNEAGIVEAVVQQTTSDLILFFVLLIVAMVLFMTPMYAMVIKDRKRKDEQSIERLENYNKREEKIMERFIEQEKQIVEVVTANTQVMSDLRATLQSDGMHMNQALSRIHTRIDEQVKMLAELGNVVAKACTSIDTALHDHRVMTEDIKKVLLTVDNIPAKRTAGKKPEEKA